MNRQRHATKPEQSEHHHKKDPKRNTADLRDLPERPVEFGGQSGPEPTRYGDWEKNGRCSDF